MIIAKVFMNFNSIKVRLKPSVNFGDLLTFISFQFHKGTIKTLVNYEMCNKTLISIP